MCAATPIGPPSIILNGLWVTGLPSGLSRLTAKRRHGPLSRAHAVWARSLGRVRSDGDPGGIPVLRPLDGYALLERLAVSLFMGYFTQRLPLLLAASHRVGWVAKGDDGQHIKFGGRAQKGLYLI